MNMEQLVEWEFAGKTQNLPRATFPTALIAYPELRSSPSGRGGKPETNSMSYRHGLQIVECVSYWLMNQVENPEGNNETRCHKILCRSILGVAYVEDASHMCLPLYR
jgi:hypothetical protein